MSRPSAVALDYDRAHGHDGAAVNDTHTVDVLVLAAHPDDAEIGCGGTILRAVDAGLAVGVADLTDGELSTHGDPTTRAQERDRATAVLGLDQRVRLGLPDCGLDRQRDAIVGLLRSLRPRVLLAPHPNDRHPDHAATGRLARDAAFLAGVGRYLPGDEPHRPSVLHHYMLHRPFEPTFVVDVGPVWERRRQAVAAYASQIGHPPAEARTAIAGPDFLAALEARAVFYGAMIGAERGEPFWTDGPLAVEGLPGCTGSGYRMFV